MNKWVQVNVQYAVHLEQKLTCPLNPDAKNPNPSKHPLAKSKMSSTKNLNHQLLH